MNPDEFEDRYRALEGLVVYLIRHMMAGEIMSREQVEDLMDTMETSGEGDPGAAYCAERLRGEILGRGGRDVGQIVDEDWSRARERARIYNTDVVPFDL